MNSEKQNTLIKLIDTGRVGLDIIKTEILNYVKSCFMFCSQAALTSLEREAKENVYAVLDPHIQYEVTINKHGEPPKYFSLSKPLTHQRAHAFDPQTVTNNDLNNNDYDNRFSTFKSGPPKMRRSNKSNEAKANKNNQNIYVCKTNNDIEYSKNPFYGMDKDEENNIEIHKDHNGNNENRNSKNYSRMYERNSSGRLQSQGKNDQEEYHRADVKRHSQRSWKLEEERMQRNQAKLKDNDRSFEELKEDDARLEGTDDKPRPGKVREIASRFNRNCPGNDVIIEIKRARPKPLQSYGHQAYLDHVFPDAIEI